LRVVLFATCLKTMSALSSASNDPAFLFSRVERSVAGSEKERMPSGGMKPARQGTTDPISQVRTYSRGSKSSVCGERCGLTLDLEAVAQPSQEPSLPAVLMRADATRPVSRARNSDGKIRARTR